MTLYRPVSLAIATMAFLTLTPTGLPHAMAGGATELAQRAPARTSSASSAAASASADKAAGRAARAGAEGQPSVATAAAAAEPPVDPMERLRLRLAERLAAPGGASASGTLDLQMGTRSTLPILKAGPALAHGSAPRHAVAAPPAGGHGDTHATPTAAAVTPHAAPAGAVVGAHAALPAAQARRTPAAAAHAGPAHWAYEGAGGPAAWGALRPDFGTCASGQRQSPIDIRGGLSVDLEPVKFDYQPSAFSVIDNGHTVQVNLPPGNGIEVGTRRFELVQFHFHRPSEERIDGRQFEMSLHLVHKDAAGKLAVVGVLLGKGPAHPAVQTVWNNLPLERNEEAAARAQINPADLLPTEKRYFTYMGSLTTPPCSEGVLWVVMRQPATLTPEQIELFARIYPMNARPVQPVAGRRIMQSQ